MCAQSPATIHSHLWLVVDGVVSTTYLSEGSCGYTLSCGYRVEEHAAKSTTSMGTSTPCG